jgi:hypothetical protein
MLIALFLSMLEPVLPVSSLRKIADEASVELLWS